MASPSDAPLYLPVDGVFVIEAEDAQPVADWEIVRDEAATNGGYMRWRGPNRYEEDDNHVGLRYCLKVETPGEYHLRIRMLRSRAGEPEIREDERNDLWLRMDGRHWMKLFANTPWEEWGWDGGLDFHHLYGKRPRATLTFEDRGVQCIEIAGRSEDVRLDRIHLSLASENIDETRAMTRSSR
ncbi:hypothetical protein [Qipengyuania vesicularis]|uniref:hypothetical protein n=1 Tax=Qipengyuania vesicularis TaxID=2867232 RepID=UPI001C87A2BC|nr:hypothetical protein [Qipengyuania vesicularis]MBX7527208.1 hypothetical protein [Qipengyuania vesicularis]